jgi:hypothetical protein
MHTLRPSTTYAFNDSFIPRTRGLQRALYNAFRYFLIGTPILTSVLAKFDSGVNASRAFAQVDLDVPTQLAFHIAASTLIHPVYCPLIIYPPTLKIDLKNIRRLIVKLLWYRDPLVYWV